MDSFFGIGAPELVLILLLAGLVMGPQRIRQVAHWLGKTTAQLQAIARGFSRQLNAELDAVDGGKDMRAAMEEVQELRRQMAELRRDVTSIAVQPFEDGRRGLQNSQKAIGQSIKPPNLGEPTPADTHTTLPKPVNVVDDPD